MLGVIFFRSFLFVSCSLSCLLFYLFMLACLADKNGNNIMFSFLYLFCLHNNNNNNNNNFCPVSALLLLFSLSMTKIIIMAPRCCSCMSNGRCVRCSCRRNGILCPVCELLSFAKQQLPKLSPKPTTVGQRTWTNNS